MSLKTILTDLRVVLSLVLAGQGAIVDTLTNAGAPAKAVSTAFAIIGIIATALQMNSEAKSAVLPTPAAPIAPAPVVKQ